MKKVMSILLAAWAFLLIGLFSVQICSAEMPDKIDLGNINTDGLDRCLLAIVNEPNLLERIDQRNFFNKDYVYLYLLRMTLNKARQFIPYDVNNPAIISDANKPINLITSLCLDDSRVYFWNALDDRDVIGWASIQISGIINMKTAIEPKLTVWIVPHMDKATSFTMNWIESVKQKSAASKALMKLAVDNDIEDINNDIEQLHGKIKSKANRFHNVKIVMSGNIFQLEINLISERQPQYGGMLPTPLWIPAEIYIDYSDVNTLHGNTSIQNNIIKEDGVLKGWDTSLPFWPPKIEEKGKETPN